MFFVDEPIGLTLAPAARINASNCVGWSLTAILETWAARKGCVAPSVLALGVHSETAANHVRRITKTCQTVLRRTA